MNPTAEYDFTVIVPVFNEEENINRLKNTLNDFLHQCKKRCCVLFVNDGSSDRSEQLIKEACNENPAFFYLSLDRNMGLSAAMKAGIDATFSPLLGYIDADLQTTPEDFNLLLEYSDEYPLVMGIRVGRKDGFVKRLSSKVANSFRRMMTGDNITDTGCPLKVLHTDYAKRIPFFTGMHRFIPALIGLQGARVKEIPVRHFPRIAGTSKYHLFNRLLGPFKDCFAFRWMKHRYIHYIVKDSDLC